MQGNNKELYELTGAREASKFNEVTATNNWVQRPEVEACNDSPHGKLSEEVAELKESIKLLQLKLNDSNESLGEMQAIKQKLESDIKVKNKSLLIDQTQCMSKRRTLPYNIVATRYY